MLVGFFEGGCGGHGGGCRGAGGRREEGCGRSTSRPRWRGCCHSCCAVRKEGGGDPKSQVPVWCLWTAPVFAGSYFHELNHTDIHKIHRYTDGILITYMIHRCDVTRGKNNITAEPARLPRKDKPRSTFREGKKHVAISEPPFSPFLKKHIGLYMTRWEQNIRAPNASMDQMSTKESVFI